MPKLTKQQMLMEMVKSTKNPIYFLENYGKVRDPVKGIVPFKLYEYQKDCIDAFQAKRFNITLKSRQCLPGDTCVDTPHGPIMIKDLKDGDKVYSYHPDNGLEIDEVYDSWNSGVRKCVKIKLRDTRNFELGENHPVLVRGKGWVRAIDLNVGDEIVDQNISFGNKETTHEEMKIMGYLITDGSTHNQVKFTNNNEEYLSEFEECVNVVFPELLIRRKPKGNGFDIFPHNQHGTNKKSSIKEWCEECGIAEKTIDKMFPSWVFELKKEYISTLLNRTFAGDGWISIMEKGNRRRLEVGLASPSKMFLEQVRMLLKMYGITSNIYEVKNMKLQKNSFFKLRITHSKAIGIFLNEIGICGKVEEVHKLISESMCHDVKFDPIVKKIELIEEKETYDISVIKNENYLINGLVVHNTGLSTITAGYIAWFLIFFSAKEVVVVADKKANAQGFIRKIKLIIRNCPQWMVPKITIDNMGSITLSNGSRVEAQATTKNAGRSESLSLLVIDEAAAIETGKVNDLWAAAYPTLSLGGSGIIISTPKGVGNFYHKQWVAAENKESDFNTLKIHWTQHPIYGKDATWNCEECGHKQEESDIYNPVCDSCGEPSLKPSSPWYVEQCRQLGDPRLIAQELDMDFLGSGENVILEEYIKKAETYTRPPEKIGGFDNNLWVWEEPKDKVQYLISADVARGDGTDYSAAHVIDLSSREQVAEYRGKLPPDLYAKLLVELGYKYNKALLAVEANSIGYATCLKIVDLEYPNIFYSMRGQFNGRDRRKLEKAMNNKEAMVPGFQTTTTTRPLAITQLEEGVRTGSFKIRSMRLIEELRTLIWNNGKPEAMAGYNDDLSMAAAIGLLIMKTTLNDLIATQESIIASLNNFGSSETGSESIESLNSNFSRSVKNQDPWTMNVGGSDEDLRWLIR